MLRLKFRKHPMPDTIQADLVLRDGSETRAVAVAVIKKKARLWQDVDTSLPTVVRTKGTVWQVEMLPPTAGAGFDPDVFERPTLKAAKSEIAARMFISIVGYRHGKSTRRIG